MKKRIFSLLVTLVVAVSVVLGVSLFANAAETDGLKGSAISLAENVTLKMEVAIAEPTDGAYAKITLPGDKVDSTQLVAAAPKSGDNYVFFAEIAIKDLEEIVAIEICNADGSTLVAAEATSAYDYCETYVTENATGEYADLVFALVYYADAANAYFDEDATVDEVATADFSKVADVAFAGTLPAGITHRSATLLLESETTIRHYFELAEGKSVGAYTFFVDLDKDGKVDLGETLTASSKTTDDGKTVYYVDIEGLTPNQLDEVYTIAVTDGTDTYTCDYSVATYAKRAYANGDAKAKNLAANLFAYSTEAGKLTGTITFNVDGGSAVAAQTYEYGVAYPITASTTKGSNGFIGWADEDGNIVDTISATQTGNVTLTAKWARSYSTEFNYEKTIYAGRCDKHADGDDADTFCDNCGFCIENCGVLSGTSCDTCGKSTGNISLFGWLNSNGSNVPYGGYSAPATVDGQLGSIVDFKGGYLTNFQTNMKNSCNWGTAFSAGATSMSLSFDMKKLYEDTDVPDLRVRARDNNKKNELSLLYVRAGANKTIHVLGNDTGVVIDTTKRHYEIIFDMSDEYKLGWTLAVDGVVKASGAKALNVSIASYTNDGYGSVRIDGAGAMWFSNYYFGPTKNVIAYTNANVPATAPITYTTGVKTDLPAPALEDGQNFLGWYADPGYKQQIDAVPVNAIGLFKVYAKIESITLKESYDFSNVAEVVSGNCANHVDGEDEDAFCDNCGYCINTCDTADHKAGDCTVCGQYLTAHTKFASFMDSKDARNNYYLANATKKDANGNDVAGTIYALSSQTNSDTPFGTIGQPTSTSYGSSYINAATAVYYDITMARAFEDGNVTGWYPRCRNLAKTTEFSPFGLSKEGEISILGNDSGVMLDTVARTYRIIIDISDGANKVLKGYLYVDGELKFEASTTIAEVITDYTHGDSLGQLRLTSAGAIWLAKIEAGTMVR